MRRAGKVGMVGVAGLNALVVGSMLLGPGRPAEAQTTRSNAGDAPVVPRSSAIAGPEGKLAADGQQEARMLLAHGLEMTIEGSTLQGMAMRAAGVGLGPAVDPRPSTAGVVGSSSAGAITAARPAGVAVPAPTTAGTGFTGAPGETVSGRPVGNGNEITPRTPVAGLPDAPQAGGVAPVAITPGVPLTAGQTASMLQREAMRSFEAGERLINQGSTTAGPDARLQQAATRYANTLRAFASQPVLRSGAPAAETTVKTPIGSVTVATSPAPAAGTATTVGADPASVALINHAVKEAIGAMKIRSIIRNMGGSSGPAGQQLMDHAMMMESEGRNAIRAFAGIGDAGPVARASGEIGSPNGSVQTLAQQANDLIAALLGLPAGAEGGGPAR